MYRMSCEEVAMETVPSATSAAGNYQRSNSTSNRPTVPPKPAFRTTNDSQHQHQQPSATSSSSGSSRLKALPLVDLTTRIRTTSASSNGSDLPSPAIGQTPLSPLYPQQYDDHFLSEEAFRSRVASVGRKSEDESNGKCWLLPGCAQHYFTTL